MTAAGPVLHHRLDGPEGAPVLVLDNALGTTLEIWDGQVPALAAGFRVLRSDRRGHGGSPVPPGPYRMDDLAGDVVRLLDRLGVERVSFCGLSIGGMVGMCLAVRAPERLERLVVCCTSPKLGTAVSWHERAATVRAGGVRAIAGGVISRWFTREFQRDHPDVVARIRAALKATPAEGYAGCCEAIAGFDVRPGLGSIASPTLVVSAAEDPVSPPKDGVRLAGAIPGARHVAIDGAAHLVNVARPEAFTAAVLAHLAPVSGVRRAGLP